ncbi:MAG: HD domain-containing protein [Clostridia bacterium]|nr:HD domain-containing protein [Clostridia bacterium]
MEQGLYLRRYNEYIEKSSQNNAELSLIAKGDGTEVMIQRIKAGEIFFVGPGDSKELMEFFYILEGQILLEQEDNDIVLQREDYFYIHHLKENVQFKVIEDVRLLYVSTKSVFQYLSESIKELNEIAKKSQEKDMYTHNHGARVKDYALKIGNKLGLSKEKLEDIGFASLFHDIGKINVPDEILKKTGRLTSEEMEYIKKHPLDGAKMVEKTYYKKIGRIIEEHHERLDGSGYPNGLMDYEICIEAKIIAVADAFDAMTTDRPYKKAMLPSEAVNELKILSGIHYDERVVNAFEYILKAEGVIK